MLLVSEQHLMVDLSSASNANNSRPEATSYSPAVNSASRLDYLCDCSADGAHQASAVW